MVNSFYKCILLLSRQCTLYMAVRALCKNCMTIIKLKLNPSPGHYAHRAGVYPRFPWGQAEESHWLTLDGLLILRRLTPKHKLIPKYVWVDWDYADKVPCLSAEHTTSSDHNADWTSDIAVTGLTHMTTEPNDNYTEVKRYDLI